MSQLDVTGFPLALAKKFLAENGFSCSIQHLKNAYKGVDSLCFDEYVAQQKVVNNKYELRVCLKQRGEV